MRTRLTGDINARKPKVVLTDVPELSNVARCWGRVMKSTSLLALLAPFALSVPAGAAVTVTPFGPGGVPLPSLTGLSSVATFDSIPQTPYGDSVQTSPNPATFTDGGGSWSGSGIVMNNGGGGSLGLYAEPYNDTTNYMAVLSGQSETVVYGKTYSELGLYWGSIDTYNVLTLFNGASSVVVPIPPVANGDQFAGDSKQVFRHQRIRLQQGGLQFERKFLRVRQRRRWRSSGAFDLDDADARLRRSWLRRLPPGERRKRGCLRRLINLAA